MRIGNFNVFNMLPSVQVEVVESGVRGRKGWIRCEEGENLEFSTESLESYFFARWEPILYDALLLAAAVEFCDRIKKRPTSGWGREFKLRIPMHDRKHWVAVAEYLHSALDFLTGDRWEIEFYDRRKKLAPSRQGMIALGSNISSVIPFSDGLDSRAVAGLMAKKLGDTLIRVRLGSKNLEESSSRLPRKPFASVPYKVLSGNQKFPETSARSRGFKFALISGLASYLAKAGEVIVPESGQGALGPALIPVGQAYEDYRNHPLFTQRMEKFLYELLGHKISFVFPQLWNTKGETLSKFVGSCQDGESWSRTWSCWQQNRHVSVEHKKRQCGICAACMLRRLSVFAAGLEEREDVYVWENLGASSFVDGVATTFNPKKITGALRQYAIAGTLHLDHLAALRGSPANAPRLDLCSQKLGQWNGTSKSSVRVQLDRLLAQHEKEWKNFLQSLGPHSFLLAWVD